MSTEPPADRDSRRPDEVPIFYLGSPSTPGGQSVGADPFAVPPAAGSASKSRARLPVYAALVTVVVVAVAVIMLVLGSSDNDTIGPGPAPTTAVPTTTSIPTDRLATTVPETSVSDPTAESTSLAKQPTQTSPTSSADPGPAPTGPLADLARLNVTAAPLNCADQYIVVLASELSLDAFASRVQEVAAAGKLPAGTNWLQSDSVTGGCAMFGKSSTTVWVLYAGPFGGPYDGCDIRLAGPADSYVRLANGTYTHFNCICDAAVNALPPVGPGSIDVRVGDLQWLLRQHKYGLSSLAGVDWGTFTTETAQAVSKFRVDHGLSASDSVDTATWSALQRAYC